jgi:hypothetical protein
MRKWGTWRWGGALIALFAALLIAAGCNESGGGGSEDSGVILSGGVVDGYVSGARVTVYESRDFTDSNRIGQGTTDESGSFRIELDRDTIPDPVYIRTQGGTDIATGLPASSMLFVGSEGPDGVNVTPLTDMHFRKFLQSGSRTAAADYLHDRLGDWQIDLFADPEKVTHTQDAVYKVLASGTQTCALPDGNYTLALVAPSEGDIHNSNATLTELPDWTQEEGAAVVVEVSDGVIRDMNTTLGALNAAQDSDTSSFITGYVQGENFILDLNVSECSTMRLAGQIGVLGSVAGSLTVIDSCESDATINYGIFAGSFLPENGLEESEVRDLMSRLYTGEKSFVFMDVLGDDHDMGIVDDFQVNGVNATDLSISASGFSVRLADDPDAVAGNSSFVNGTLVEIGGKLTGLAALHFREDATGDHNFIFQPVGLREGIYVVADNATGELYAAGAAFLSGSSSLTPTVESDATYSGTVVQIPFAALEQPRDLVLNDYILTKETFIPQGVNALDSAYSRKMSMITGEITMILNGGMLGLYTKSYGDSNSSMDSPYDLLSLSGFCDTGAFQGTAIRGDTNSSNVKHPMPYVGFALRSWEQPPRFSGSLDFLYRILYASDVETASLSYAYGEIDISKDTAVLSYTDSRGETGRAELTLDRQNGIYHMHGPIGPSGEAQYTDIFWPVGGGKATVLACGSSSITGNVVEIGEAFISF